MTDHSTCNDLMPGTGTALVKAVHCNRIGSHGGSHENGLWRWPQSPKDARSRALRRRPTNGPIQIHMEPEPRVAYIPVPVHRPGYGGGGGMLA